MAWYAVGMMGRTAVCLCLLSGAAIAQTKPGVAAIPLEVDPLPVLVKAETELRAAFQEALEGQAVVAPSGREAGAALKSVKRQDFRESNEAVAKFADQVGSLYAIFTALELTAKGNLVMTGRVVRNDGVSIKSHQAQMARGAEPLPQVVKVLARQFLTGLGVSMLPSAKEVVVKQPDPVTVKPPDSPVRPPEIFSPPPLPAVDRPSPQRTAGWVLAGSGIAATLAGVLLITVDRPISDSDGNIINTAKIRDFQGRQGAGFVVAGLGVAAAVTGAILLATLTPEKPVALTVGPNSIGLIGQF